MRQNLRTVLGSLLCAVAVVLTVWPTCSMAEDEQVGNFFKITTKDEFKQGTTDKTVIKASKECGDGAVQLAKADGKKKAKYETEGTYTSAVMNIQQGDWFTPSWNAATPDGTWVEVKISAHIPAYDKDGQEYWTEFLSMGKWGQSIHRGSTHDRTSGTLEGDGSKARALMDTDIFQVAGSGIFFTQIKLQAVLHTDNPKETPTLTLLAGSSRNTQAPLESRIVKTEMTKSTENLDVEMQFPAFSQDIRDKSGLTVNGVNLDKLSISCCICSPTTITGSINYRGIVAKQPEDWLPEEIALNCQDFNYGFGNWAYTCAAAGSFGYPSYARYGSLELLKSELAAGYPVGVGVRYSNYPGGKQPYVENSPIRNTDGHLLLVRGFKTIDGVDYIFVNDSAAGSDAGCILRYRCDQFVQAWSPNCMCYIVREKEPGTGTSPIVRRIPAKLQATKKADPNYGQEYTLKVKGKAIKLDPLFSTATPEMLQQRETFKRNEVGRGGVIGYIVDAVDDKTQTKPEALANCKFHYTIVSPDGNIYLSQDRIQKALPEGYKGKVRVTVYVMCNNGKTYVATLTK